ncbi:MAG: hypothetical protein H0T79_14045 [Deltaproteobacteria bacterium]|nr:hypothetical protein [Deltaproteobacteria bacterium]
MPSYENTDGTSWSIELAGNQLVIAADGKQTIRKFVTPAHAEKQLASLTEAKLAAGFALVERVRSAPTEADDELVAQLVDDPYDAATYAVHGDALTRRGDPRGELITLMAAAEAKPSKKARAAVADFLEDHADELLGGLVEHVADIRAYDEGALVWRHGYLHQIKLEHVLPRSLAEVLSHPSCRLLAELELRGCTTETIEVLAERAPGSLRVLELHAQRDLEDLGAVWRRVPRLRRLRIHARAFELGAIDLPLAERIEIVARVLSGGCVRSVVAAAWPKLERLKLRFGGFRAFQLETPRRPEDATFADLAPLLARTDLTALTHLRIVRGFTSASARVVGRAAFAPQLHCLELSGGDLTDADANELAKHLARFTALKELVIGENELTTRGTAMLRSVSPHVIDAVDPVMLGDHLDRAEAGDDSDYDEDGDADDHFDSIEE